MIFALFKLGFILRQTGLCGNQRVFELDEISQFYSIQAKAHNLCYQIWYRPGEVNLTRSPLTAPAGWIFARSWERGTVK